MLSPLPIVIATAMAVSAFTGLTAVAAASSSIPDDIRFTPEVYVHYAKENQALGPIIKFDSTRAYTIKMQSGQYQKFAEAADQLGIQMRSLPQSDWEGPLTFFTGSDLNKLKKAGLLRAEFGQIKPGETLYRFAGTAADEVALRETLRKFGHAFEGSARPSGVYGYGYFSSVWHSLPTDGGAPKNVNGYFSAQELVHLERAGLKTASMFKRIGKRVAPVAVVAGAVAAGTSAASASEVRMNPTSGSGAIRLEKTNVNSVANGFSSFQEPSMTANEAKSGKTSR